MSTVEKYELFAHRDAARRRMKSQNLENSFYNEAQVADENLTLFLWTSATILSTVIRNAICFVLLKNI